ncbi:MAG: hypothetical protein E6R05_02920 [Candidatus Moraniibacteriota bacterium]|nr:MAG: hypothetical protein E6R05_02920 [Candidatus Moranbacteria bacterium]
MIQVTAVTLERDGNQTSEGGFLVNTEHLVHPFQRESNSSGEPVDATKLLNEISQGLCNFVVLTGALWKRDAFANTLKEIGMEVSLVSAFKGVDRKELKTTDTKAIVDQKFDQQLGDYIDWLNSLEERDLVRELARGGKVRTFSAMDVNSVLNDDKPMNKQPWQDDAEKLPEYEKRMMYAKQVANMFRSQARKISGLTDAQLANQEVPMNLDLNVIERFGMYRLEKYDNNRHQAVPIGPKVYVKNKGFIRFMAWFNEDGELWNKGINGNDWVFDRVSDYFTDFDADKAGRSLNDIPYGIAWEYFLHFLNVDVNSGIDQFRTSLDIPENFGGGHKCIKNMADGYHVHGLEQALEVLKNTVGQKPSSEIVIWNYPK